MRSDAKTGGMVSVVTSVQASSPEVVKTAVSVRRKKFFMTEERGVGRNLRQLCGPLRFSAISASKVNFNAEDAEGPQRTQRNLLVVVGRDDEFLADLDLVGIF